MSEPKSIGERICAKLHEAGILKPFKIVAGAKIIDDELAVQFNYLGCPSDAQAAIWKGEQDKLLQEQK